MFRLCVVKIFRPGAELAAEDVMGGRPAFVQYAHSCVDHECHAPCDGVLVLDKCPSRNLVPWSRNNSAVRNITESWWWKDDALTRFVLSEYAVVSLAENGNLTNVSNVSCTDVQDRRLLPKYEPRVPVQEEVCKPAMQHLTLTSTEAQNLHLFVCHVDNPMTEHTMEQSCAACGVNTREEPVLFLQFVYSFVDIHDQDATKCLLFAGELPGTVSNETCTESREVWLLCRWSNLKHVMMNTLSPEKTADVCKYSCALHITM